MEDADFKDDFHATPEVALRTLARIHRITKPLGYYASVYGSSIRGGGHDVDVHVMGLGYETEVVTPDVLAMRLIAKLATVVRLYEQHDVGDVSDVYVIMLVGSKKSGTMVDLHIKGDAGL